jgi:hypothetical protein
MTSDILFQRALDRAILLREKYPELETIYSIIKQLEYLIELDAGRSTDRSRLNEIIVGVQAAREIEPLDPDLAEMLYAVSEQSKHM